MADIKPDGQSDQGWALGTKWNLCGLLDTKALRSTSPKTATGIGIGSTRTELLAAYPGIENATTSLGTPTNFGTTYVTPNGKGQWLSFQLDDDAQVAQINLTPRKGVPGEFC